MKKSTAAFWLLISMVLLCAIVAIFGMIYNKADSKNFEITQSFFDIMKYAIALVGGGYLGVQVGESENGK